MCAGSPLFAGIVTLANAQRLIVGKQPLGFLNPVLYSLPADIFNDVTVGVRTRPSSACVCVCVLPSA